MRRLICGILTTITSLCAFGQNVEPYTLDNPDNKLCAGIRGGWEYTMPGLIYEGLTSYKSFTSGHGISVGGFLQIPLKWNLYVEPGVSFYYNTYDYTSITIYGTDDEGHDTIEYIFPEVRKSGFHVPVPIGFHFDLWENASVGLITGPQAALGISNVVSVNSKYLGLTDMEYNHYGEGGKYRRFDLEWLMGINGRVRHWRLDVTLSFGLLDLHKGPPTFHEYRATASLCYIF